VAGRLLGAGRRKRG